jgi:hypothetical protein
MQTLPYQAKISNEIGQDPATLQHWWRLLRNLIIQRHKLLQHLINKARYVLMRKIKNPKDSYSDSLHRTVIRMNECRENTQLTGPPAEALRIIR